MILAWMNRLGTRRLSLIAVLTVLFGLGLAAPAQAGVATAGAVLLDPYDPVPEIQFRHFGGYGCSYGCGGYSDCGYCGASWHGCYDGCRPHYRRYRRCDDDCDRGGCRDHCDRDCGDRCDRGCGDRCDSACDHDCNRGCEHDCDRHCDHDCNRDGRTATAPCQSERCYDAEHYERRWRDGNRVGQEWLDRGTRERTLPEGGHAGGYYDNSPSWRDDDDAPPPPPPPPPPQDDHHRH